MTHWGGGAVAPKKTNKQHVGEIKKEHSDG